MRKIPLCPVQPCPTALHLPHRLLERARINSYHLHTVALPLHFLSLPALLPQLLLRQSPHPQLQPVALQRRLGKPRLPLYRRPPTRLILILELLPLFRHCQTVFPPYFVPYLQHSLELVVVLILPFYFLGGLLLSARPLVVAAVRQTQTHHLQRLQLSRVLLRLTLTLPQLPEL